MVKDGMKPEKAIRDVYYDVRGTWGEAAAEDIRSLMEFALEMELLGSTAWNETLQGTV